MPANLIKDSKLNEVISALTKFLFCLKPFYLFELHRHPSQTKRVQKVNPQGLLKEKATKKPTQMIVGLEFPSKFNVCF